MWVGQSPDERLFATVSWDLTVVLCNAETGWLSSMHPPIIIGQVFLDATALASRSVMEMVKSTSGTSRLEI